MASTSASREIERIASENNALRTEILKVLPIMKKIAVDFETDRQSEEVKQLENAATELVETYEKCGHQTSAIEAVAKAYESGSEVTDFKKLLEIEFKKSTSSSPSVPQNHTLLRQFREAVWNIHHRGQPMPGEEQEDIVMTSTQSSLLNFTCPISGKPIFELEQPVRSVDCKHIYEKAAALQFIAATRGPANCAAAGCPKPLLAERLVCDPLLLVEIDEMRSMNRQTDRTQVIEDYTTGLDEEDDN